MQRRQTTPGKPAESGQRESLYKPRLHRGKPAKWQGQSHPFLGRLVVSGALMLLAVLAFNLFFE